MALKGCSYVGASLSDCMYSLALARDCIRCGHSDVFPQGMLAAFTLVGGEAGDGGARSAQA